jgi:serine/threonine protein kinase
MRSFLASSPPFSDVHFSNSAIQRLGIGQFSDVYPGTMEGYDRPVAVKVSRYPVISYPDQLNFLREVEIVGLLHHFALLPILNFALSTQGRPATVWPKAKGDLEKALVRPRGRPEPWFDAYDATKKSITLLGIAAGMAYMHKHKAIHRDLKPENVLLDDDLHPQICDYGFARQAPNGSWDSFEASAEKGTPWYMAPETLEGGKCSPAVDVYAFGMTVYRMIVPTIDKSWRNKSRHQFDKDVIAGSRPEIPESVEDNMKQLVEDCWQREPHRRPRFYEVVRRILDQRIVVPGCDVDGREYQDYARQVEHCLGAPPPSRDSPTV